MSEIKLYNSNTDRKKLEKDLNNKIADIDTMQIKEPCSVINPVVIVSRSSVGKQWANVNYAYIPMFHRYYFVDNITLQHDGLLELALSVDVLMTYADDLKGQQLEVVRSSSLNSKLYIDPEMPMQANKLLSYKTLGLIPESVSASSKNYYLTVAGG